MSTFGSSEVRLLPDSFGITADNISDAAREFPGDSWESHSALQICNRIMDTFIAAEGSKESIKECRKIAQEYQGNVDSSSIYDNDKPALITAVGHCHIDTCWLWP